MVFQNALLSEIRRFYPTEYAIGKHALELIDSRLGVRLPRDEAASIAMHLLNAEYDITVSEAFTATELLNRMLDIVAENTGRHLQEDENYYGDRFITHLIFLAQRVLKNESLPVGDEILYRMMESQYPVETACAKAISQYIQSEYGYLISHEETANLAIHIRRVGLEKDEPNHV